MLVMYVCWNVAFIGIVFAWNTKCEVVYFLDFSMTSFLCILAFYNILKYLLAFVYVYICYVAIAKHALMGCMLRYNAI